MGPDRQVDHRAAKQHGVISHSQARAAGLSESAIWRRLETSAWIQLTHGVYAMASSRPTWERQLSAALLSRPGSLAAGVTAAYLHGFTGFKPSRPTIMTGPDANARLSIARVIRSNYFDEVARITVQGFGATSPAETLWTLARDTPRKRLFDLVDEVILRRQATAEHFDLILDRVRRSRQRGLRNFRDAVVRTLPEAPAVSATLLEVHLYRLLDEPGIPRATTQARFLLHNHPSRVDAFIEDWQLVVEADGRNWHAKQSDFQNDRDRDNALAALGIVVLRFTWESLTHTPDHCLRTLLDTGHHRRVMNRA